VDVEAYAMENACHLISGRLAAGRRDQTVVVADVGAHEHDDPRPAQPPHRLNREQTRRPPPHEEIQRPVRPVLRGGRESSARAGCRDNYIPDVLDPFKEAMSQQVNRGLQFFYLRYCFRSVDHISSPAGAPRSPGWTSSSRRGWASRPASPTPLRHDVALARQCAEPQATRPRDDDRGGLACGASTDLWQTSTYSPGREVPQKKRQRDFALMVLGGIIAAAGVMGGWHLYVEHLISNQKARKRLSAARDRRARREDQGDPRHREDAERDHHRMDVIQRLQESRPAVVQ